jgi:hypothetical protein
LAAGATFTTLAANQANEGVWEYFEVDPGLLNPVGETNVLAVEVHQQAVTSSDVSFDAELVFAARSPVSVLFNDQDPDPGTVLSVTAVNGQAANVGVPIVLPSGATLAMNVDGTFIYSADGDPGVDTFTYTVSDGSMSDTGTVTINIGNVNEPPVANDDGPYTVNQGGSLTTVADPQVLIPLNATWDYLDQIENQLGTSDPYPVDGSGNAWNDSAFNIATSTIGPWGTGPAGLFAGAIDGFTPASPNYIGVDQVTGPLFGVDAAPDTTSNLVTTYLFRTEFTLTRPASWLLID